MSDAHSAAAAVTLDPAELADLRALVESRTGLVLEDAPAFAAAVARQLRERRVSLAVLLRLVRQSRSDLQELVDALFLPAGAFFAHPALFAALREKVLPELHLKKFWESPRRLRFWSAGCGAGQEAYSLAITLAEALDPGDAWEVDIFATDVSRSAVCHAQRGVYSAADLAPLSSQQRAAGFVRVGSQYMVSACLRHMVTFETFIPSAPAFTGRFDAIFCTGLLPRLSSGGRDALLRAFHSSLAFGGCLFVPAESLAAVPAEDFHLREFAGARYLQKPATIPLAGEMLTETVQ
jgi:chemotaxis protein methyltransferase CheR